MFKDFTFKRTRGSGAILNTGDEMQIRFGGEIIPAHIVEATQYKTAYIVKYRPLGREITCVVSVFPGVTNLPNLSGSLNKPEIFNNVVWMYYPDPQDKKRVHIWPCPTSHAKGSLGSDVDVFSIAQQRIDHVISLQKYQNGLLEIVPGTQSAATSKEERMNEQEVRLHKSWWR
jgi:hypothetical protein